MIETIIHEGEEFVASPYAGYYASRLGNVLLKTERKQKLLKQCMSRGYKKVTLFYPSRKQHQAHRIIAETFLPNPENKPEVNHINGIKTDNRLENLEWVTRSENSLHAFRIGLIVMGKHRAKPMSEAQKRIVLNIENGIYYKGIQEAADSVGIKYSAMRSMLQGQNPNRTPLRYAT